MTETPATASVGRLQFAICHLQFAIYCCTESGVEMSNLRREPANTTGLLQGPWNFLGLPEELANPARSRAWVLPIPYEGTTCYGAGTRNGPAAIIAASWRDRAVRSRVRLRAWQPSLAYTRSARSLPIVARPT